MNKNVTVIKRNRMTFYIFDETVTISNGDMQHTSYDTFGEWSSTSFLSFRDAIRNSKPEDVKTISDVVAISSMIGVYGRSTKKPDISEYNIEYIS